MVGPVLLSAGLVINMIASVLLWWMVPRDSVPLIASGGPATAPRGQAAKYAERIGWPLLALGFLLQLLGTWAAR
jgi:hypothetical protein